MHANTLESTTTTATAAQLQEQSPAPAPGPARADLYAGIHKALRLFMTRTLCEIGSTDPDDADEVQASLGQLERLLAMCEVHLKDENEFVHPALERAQPGSAARVAAEHVHHAEAIADLRDLAGLVADGRAATRGAALDRLYRALALFVADNLQHMDYEQTAHNALLWAHYTDAELMEIEGAIVASIPPAVMTEALLWFIPALNAPERAGMLSGMRSGMPGEVFANVLGIAAATLGAADRAKLARSLGLSADAISAAVPAAARGTA